MRRLARFCGHGVTASLVVLAPASCGGGERPPPEKEPLPPTVAAPEGDTITISPLSRDGLVFGENSFVDCGKQAPEKILTLSNPTNDVVNFRAKLTAGAELYTLNPAEGGIPIRGKTTIQVIPKPIPIESEVGPDLYAGTLEITTDVKKEVEDPPTVIRLHQTARGAIITSTLQSPVDFGDVKVGTTQPIQFSMTNTGNVDATASFSLGGSDFKIDGGQSSSALLAPNGSVNKTLSLSPDDTIPYSDTLNVSFNTTAVHCKPKPTSPSVKGKGSSSVGVTPGTLPFGLVPCGETAPPQTITITSTVQMTFTPSLGRGSNSFYTLTDGAGTTVPLNTPVSMAAGATYTLKVVPKPVGRPGATVADGLSDTLTLLTSVGSTHTVNLMQTARGAIFEFDKSKIAHEDTELAHTTFHDFNIRNVGNAEAQFGLAVVPMPPPDPAPPYGTFTLLGSPTQSGIVGDVPQTLKMVSPGIHNAQVVALLALTAGGVLCKDLPANIPIEISTSDQ